jgi:hypothetical protein
MALLVLEFQSPCDINTFRNSQVTPDSGWTCEWAWGIGVRIGDSLGCDCYSFSQVGGQEPRAGPKFWMVSDLETYIQQGRVFIVTD